MPELVDMNSATSTASIEHYSIEVVTRSLRFHLRTKPLRCVIWAVEQMQLSGHGPEARNEYDEKHTDCKQPQISITTHTQRRFADVPHQQKSNDERNNQQYLKHL